MYWNTHYLVSHAKSCDKRESAACFHILLSPYMFTVCPHALCFKAFQDPFMARNSTWFITEMIRILKEEVNIKMTLVGWSWNCDELEYWCGTCSGAFRFRFLLFRLYVSVAKGIFKTLFPEVGERILEILKWLPTFNLNDSSRHSNPFATMKSLSCYGAYVTFLQEATFRVLVIAGK